MKISDGETPDRYGRVWPKGTEQCDECRQPDNCGDCAPTCGRLTDDEVRELGGATIRIVIEQYENLVHRVFSNVPIAIEVRDFDWARSGDTSDCEVREANGVEYVSYSRFAQLPGDTNEFPPELEED